MTEKKIDYRESHTAQYKGKSYQNAFEEMNYRKYIWSLEKNILNEIIKRHFIDKKQIKYLDFACGTGRIINFLEDNMFESIGVDISESMISIALKNVKNSKIINADITKKNIFNENYFDLITAFRFFLNAQPELRVSAFNIISKILKKDGYFIFNTHLNKSSILFRLAIIYRKMKDLNSEINATDIKELTQLIEKAGLQIASVYGYGLMPIFNENTKIPIWLIDTFEKIFSKIPFLRHFSTYQIFVCKHENI